MEEWVAGISGGRRGIRDTVGITSQPQETPADPGEGGRDPRDSVRFWFPGLEGAREAEEEEEEVEREVEVMEEGKEKIETEMEEKKHGRKRRKMRWK